MQFAYRPNKLTRLLVLLLLFLPPISPAFAENPTGGSVVGGTAAISSAGSVLNVNAASDRTIVNWQSFNVGAGNTTNFNLPSASAAILNRVTTTGNPSAINGALNSNGNVYLVNPSGIVVGPSGVINANGFTASTFDIGNRAFMNGGAMAFRGDSNASIVNQGTINTGAGGAHFMANQINNSGAITSSGGSVTMGSGQSVTYSNGVTHVEANMATLQNGYSETASLINNSGTIRATGAVMSGGDVYLTNPGGRVLNSGVISASQVAVSSNQFNQVGTVDVSGQVGGQVIVNAQDTLIQGTVNATGVSEGGSVSISSGTVDQYATIDVSASAGAGGDVAITTQNGYTATTSGNIVADGAHGGEIAITGQGRVVSSGTMSAVGSQENGGNIDVSSDFKTSLLGATLDASGETNGGQIRVGGEFAGGRDLAIDQLTNSSETLIGGGTQLNAQGRTGDGGTAIIWSDDRTQFYGSVDVSGRQGAGGFVEISSAGTLVYQSLNDVQTGGGTVLLDPKNGVIVDLPPSGLSVIEFALADETQPLDPFDGAGFSVALNADGTLLASGAPFDDGGDVAKIDSGAVYLFSIDPNSLLTESQLIQILRDGIGLADGSTLRLEANDHFGKSVALNSAGSVLAVGAPNDDPVGFDQVSGDFATGNTGAVYLFEIDATEGGSLPDLQNVIRDDSLLAGDGTFDLSPNEDPSTSAANPMRGLDNFGEAVALNGVGDRLAVGTTDRFPRVYLFELDAADLSAAPDLGQVLQRGSNTGSLILDPVDGAMFGENLALNATGDLLAVGAEREFTTVSGFNNDGAVYLFELNANDYSAPAQFQQRIATGSPLADGGNLSAANASLGSAVSFARDGEILAVGASSIAFGVGGVFAFGLDGNDPSLAPELLFSTPLDSFTFANGTQISLDFAGLGESLALSETANLIVFGLPLLDGRTGSVTNSGGGLLFSIDSNLQPVLGQLVADNRAPNVIPSADDFGSVVALNDDATTLAVGASGANEVYLFDLDADLGQRPTLSGIIQAGLSVTTPAGTEVLDFGNQDQFGSALAFNSTGDRLAVGATGDDFTSLSNTDKGAIYLFEVDSNDPTARLSLPRVIQEQTLLADGSVLTLSNSSEFGTAVALDASGNRLVAGQSLNARVFLFDFGASGFAGPVSLAQTLEDGIGLAGGGVLDLSSTRAFGTSVDITRDGSSLVVGAPRFNGSEVLLFNLDEGDWTAPVELAQRLADGSPIQGGGTLDTGNSIRFGTGVGFDSTGSRLVVADIGVTDALFLFETQTDLSQPLNLIQVIGQGTELSDGTFLRPSTGFASSVSLSGDGNVLAVGSTFAEQFHLFEFETGNYSDALTVQQSLGIGSLIGEFNGVLAEDQFGTAVSLNGSGDRLAVSDDRRVFLFDADTSVATEPVLTQIIGNGSQLQGGGLFNETSSRFGESLALNDTGEILAVGNPNDNGSVYVFGLDANDSSALPSLEKIFRDSASFGIVDGVDLDSFDRFGTSLAFNARGDLLAIGARGDEGVGNMFTSNEGAVYLFSLNPEDLSEAATLGQIIQQGSTLADGSIFQTPSSDDLGYSVALNAIGDRLAVGVNTTLEAGAVYLFSIDPDDTSSAVVLAQVLEDQSSLADGSILELETQNGVFQFFADRFGRAVAFDDSGTRLFVGAPGDDGANNNSQDAGAVYEFELDAGDLSLAPTLVQLMGVDGSGNPGNVIGMESQDLFGSSVAVTSTADFLAVGAPGGTGNSGNARDDVGSVFLISPGGSTATPLNGDLSFGDFPVDTTFIDPDDIAAILNAGNDLTLQFSNDLDIRSDIVTASMGVGTLTVQTGRSINVAPGTEINVGDGSLDFEFNSGSAIPDHRDPGSAILRLNDVSIVANGDDSLVRLSADQFDDFLFSDDDTLIHISGSTINAPEVQIGNRASFIDDQRILIDGGTEISSGELFLRAANNASGIGVEISGDGTKLSATERLSVATLGGVRIADGALLEGVGDGEVLVGGFQFPNDPLLDSLISKGDSIFVENASIRTENGQIVFALANADALSGNVFGSDGPVVERNSLSLIDSEIQAGGMGRVALEQTGDDAYQVKLTRSTIRGQDVLIVLNGFAFSTQAGLSTVNLEDQSQITTASDGELRIFLPQQAGILLDASSNLNGVAGNSLVDGNGNLINSLGIGEFIGDTPLLPIDTDYLGTVDANVAFYLASIDLTPGLFFTANDGQSTYGQTPVDPGLSITRGMLQDGDTLESIGVGTNFSLTQFSDAGEYTINVIASGLDPKYRLLGTADGTFTILPADLFVTGGTYFKTYGETFVFPDDDFTVEGLVNGEMIGPVHWLSLGSQATAPVMAEPFAVGLSVSGQGSFNPMNYNIDFTNGGLTVNPAPLLIDPLAQTKVYGDAMLDRTRFAVEGLQNGESIQQVGFTSNGGIAAMANVGTYDLAATQPVVGDNGFDAGNYSIEFGTLEGGLEVTPADLIITALDQVKLFGESLVFDGTEFSTQGLRNGNTVTAVDLTSEGANAMAELGEFAISISNPVGTFDPTNYRVNLIEGALNVVEEIIVPPSLNNLTFDRFGRYQDFARTISSLVPTSPGSIDSSQATSDDDSEIAAPDRTEAASGELDDSGEVYLLRTIKNSSQR